MNRYRCENLITRHFQWNGFRSLSLSLIVCLFLTPSSVFAKAPHVAKGMRGMVVSVSQPASEAGAEILRQGGTAVDAAVTVALVLQVTWPEAGNIAGGGFMMVHPKPGEAPVCIEYRETAPAAATPTMFQLGESRHTCKAVGVPGTLRGIDLAHRRYGRLPWRELVQPAIKLAEQGFPVNSHLAASLNGVLKRTPKSFTELHRVYGPPNGSEWRAGDVLIQPDLANTFRQIAEFGPDALYLGEVAQQLVAEMQRNGGLITLQDLAEYQPLVRKPIEIEFRGYQVFGPPLPSSGGICLAEMLGALRNSDFKIEDRWSPQSVHLRAELMKRAFADRAKFMGDPAFSTFPEHLLQLEYADKLLKGIDPQRATPSKELVPELFEKPESPSTTHFSVVDADGMAVSNTYTLEESFGARIVVQGAGFLLNNEMGDFNWRPGHTDEVGRIGTPPNVIAPGKRMLSSQSPVLVLKEGQTVLVTGSPGGRTIINTVFCVLMNVLAFDLDLEAAVAEPRFHHQWFPDRIVLEESALKLNPELVAKLQSLGHEVTTSGSQGDAHSIMRDQKTGTVQGAADPRKGGFAAAE